MFLLLSGPKDCSYKALDKNRNDLGMHINKTDFYFLS
jgi:hypothetical protein